MGGGRRSRARLVLACALVASAAQLFACEFIYSIPVEEGPDGGARDAQGERPTADVHGDRRSDMGARDAVAPADVAEAAPVTTYNPLASTPDWTTFNTAALGSSAVAFGGGTFDGRYVYLGPNVNTVAVRYDTHGTFTSNGSWSSFDPGPLLKPTGPDGGASDAGLSEYPFYGCAFDGRYVYYLPGGFFDSTPTFAARYDTTASFTTAASWESFETTTLAKGMAYGFGGGTFDGRYVYVVPSSTSIMVRYDTTAAFSGAGWSTFDLSAVIGDAGVYSYEDTGFLGALFDGRYVYLIPQYGTYVFQFDTKGTFSSPSSWVTFDISLINSDTLGFEGGAFDGRYLYFAPGPEGGIVVRYDTTQSFTNQAAWTFLDTTVTVNKKAGGFFGAAFDGRFVYFVPYEGVEGVLPSGLVVQYDTTGNFYDANAWTTFETQPLDNAMGFNGAVFDGQYMYFVPYYNGANDGVVARFNAKSPPSMPVLPAFHGSFF